MSLNWNFWLQKTLGLPNRSYSQSGEDLIVDTALRGLGISRPFYVDIGAYDPRHLSNTYLFYRRGAHGICIEPQPHRWRRLRRARPRDLCLNLGVGATSGTRPLYVLSQDSLTTFSKHEADRVCAYGRTTLLRTIPTEMTTLTQLFERHHVTAVDFLSIDLEGEEKAVLESLDLNRWRPKVICAETLTYTEDKSETKQLTTIDYLKGCGYFLYGDTYINSVFVDQTAWSRR